MKLYLLTTKKDDKFYVIAENVLQAENLLKEHISMSDVYESDYHVKNIEVVTSEIEKHKDVPVLYNSDHKLIMPDTLEHKK